MGIGSQVITVTVIVKTSDKFVTAFTRIDIDVTLLSSALTCIPNIMIQVYAYGRIGRAWNESAIVDVNIIPGVSASWNFLANLLGCAMSKTYIGGIAVMTPARCRGSCLITIKRYERPKHHPHGQNVLSIR